LSRLPGIEELHDHLWIGASGRFKFPGRVKCVAFAVEDRKRRYAFLNWDVVLLHHILILVVAPNVYMHNVIVLVDDGLNLRLMKAIIECKAVETPVGAKDKEHMLVVLGGRRERFGDLLFGIRMIGIKLAQL